MTLSDATAEKVREELERGTHLSIIKLVDSVIEKACAKRASDIHISPGQKDIRVRLRIDGILHNAYVFPKHIQSEVISRIKVLARLRTDEHKATQDGRFRYVFPDTGGRVDIRVSIVPAYHGENIVLRLLSENAEEFTLESLGFSSTDREKILTALRKQSGMILATGPTGSGKTTTLYTLLKMLHTPEVSIVTIEDPIEYAIDDIEQIQVNNKSGLSFANGLRSILRQDPNIIMVGEVRDAETAGIAVNTALTGHLLLSTLHTKDAATTLPRLLDMGIEEYLVASTVSLATGQRLVRKLCDRCKVKKVLSSGEKESLALTALSPFMKETSVFFKSAGCDACGQSGFQGRICIHEVLVCDDMITEAILRKASSSEIQKIAVSRGMTTMLEDGFRKAVEGKTTLEEILRVISE